MFTRTAASVSQADAEVAAARGDVVVYWRKGCVYCLRLTVRLAHRAPRAVWVDIWADPAAAAYVRSVNDGDETVPTVLIDGEVHTNPPPGVVARALA